MKFATPENLETEAGEENKGDVSVVDPTEATVDLPESGTVTVAEALAEHDEQIVVARGMGDGTHERLERLQETIERQQAQIEELREAVGLLAGEGGRSIEWESRGWK